MHPGFFSLLRLFSVQHPTNYAKAHIWSDYLRLIFLILTDQDNLRMQHAVRSKTIHDVERADRNVIGVQEVSFRPVCTC